MRASPPAEQPRLVQEIDPLFIGNRVTQLIERFAPALFVLVGLLYIVSFNGRWRIGLDSANYRGLADSIAAGRGYHFGLWAGKTIYPGYPLLLAAVQKLFGRHVFMPVAECALMLSLSALTLLVTYRLILLHYPKWVAVTMTVGVASNAWYLQQSSELMTDIPFLLGVMMALYGWDLLRLGTSHKRAATIAWLIAGLVMAASMRPTFLILVAAWMATCALGLILRIPPSRKFYAICLAVMLIIWAAMVALDPRARGFHPLAGGYEREALDLLPGEQSQFQNLVHILNKQLPGAFFGEQLSIGSFKRGGVKYVPSAIFMSLVLIASIGLLAKRHPLWALLAWGTIATTVITSDEPRYYLMVLPILLLAFLKMLLNVGRKLPRFWADALLVGGMALVTLNNLSASVHFVKEQRSPRFLEEYRDGKMQAVIAMADEIRAKVKEDETVLGPSGSVLSYLSGRHVFTQREILPHRGHVRLYPRIVRGFKITYAIFPATLYRDKEPAIARLMERAVLRPGRRIAEVKIDSTAMMRLAELRVVIPPGDWTKLPKVYSQDIRRSARTR